MMYADRRDAGRRLAAHLSAFAGRGDVVVLALPRGGVPVGFEVACALHAPLDVFLVRKLGVPGHEELAMGAIASGGVRVLNDDVVHALHIGPDVLEAATSAEQKELTRREQAYRGSRPAPDLEGRVVILVDDGLATGSTMRAAVAAVRKLHPARVVVAVPVAAQDTCRDLEQELGELICAATPAHFMAVGQFYTDFAQTGDAEVHDLLRQADLARAATPRGPRD